MHQDRVETLKALKHQLIQTFRTKTHISWVPILTEFLWATDHLLGHKIQPVLKIIIQIGAMCHIQITCLTLRTRIKTITTLNNNSSKILTLRMEVIRSNKCNNNQLSKEGRISLRGRDSLITKLTTQWIIKTKLTTKRMGHHHLRITGMARQSKITCLSKKFKTRD